MVHERRSHTQNQNETQVNSEGDIFTFRGGGLSVERGSAVSASMPTTSNVRTWLIPRRRRRAQISFTCSDARRQRAQLFDGSRPAGEVCFAIAAAGVSQTSCQN